MNRAEKRRKKKLADKAAKTLRPAQENSLMPTKQQQELTIQQGLDLAIKHQKTNDLLKAENIYQQILQVEPNQPVALHLLGIISYQVGKSEIAIKLFKKAIAVEPHYTEAYCNLGNVLQALGRSDEAIVSFRKAIEINPLYTEFYFSKLRVYKEQKNYSEIIETSSIIINFLFYN